MLEVDFFITTRGRFIAIAVIEAGTMPEDSIVITRVAPESLKSRANSSPIVRMSSTSTWWLRKESTSRMCWLSALPSLRMRCLRSSKRTIS